MAAVKWSSVSWRQRGGGLNCQVSCDDSHLCVIKANLLMHGLFEKVLAEQPKNKRSMKVIRQSSTQIYVHEDLQQKNK